MCYLLRLALLGIVALGVLVVIILTACTLVYVGGDNNRINDTGGDLSSSMSLRRHPQQPASAPPAPHLPAPHLPPSHH